MDKRNSSPTPEQQLLKLIEQPELANGQKGKVRRKGAGALSLGVLRGRFSFLREKMKGRVTAGKRPPGIKGANRVLGFCTLVVAMYLAVDVVNSIVYLKTPPTLEGAEDLGDTGGIAPDANHLPLQKPYYPNKVKGRNIFDFVSQGDSNEMEMQEARPTQKTLDELMEDLMAGLKFKGRVMWPGKPQEVRIQDETGKTYRLKIGDSHNGLEVVDIQKTYVVLRYRGIEKKLR